MRGCSLPALPTTLDGLQQASDAAEPASATSPAASAAVTLNLGQYSTSSTAPAQSHAIPIRRGRPTWHAPVLLKPDANEHTQDVNKDYPESAGRTIREWNTSSSTSRSVASDEPVGPQFTKPPLLLEKRSLTVPGTNASRPTTTEPVTEPGERSSSCEDKFEVLVHRES